MTDNVVSGKVPDSESPRRRTPVKSRNWSFVAKSAALGATMIIGLSACGGGSDSSSAASESTAATEGDVSVTLITKTSDNPFFVSMQESAKEAAAANGVNLTLAAGKEDGDEQTQVQAIENAISAGQQGILITPNGPGVNAAIEKARAAGIYVIALDTPPDPPDTVDITFATDNYLAGELIGQWTAGTLAGEPAVIAMLDLFDDKVVTVDVARDTGFLNGMGIATPDPNVNGSEAPTGNYSGGSYTIACHEATQGAEDGGRTAMETCLSKNPDINVVYTINEPAAAGAFAALQAVGKEEGVTIVSVDGGCAGVQNVAEGVIGATSQQYPGQMAALGIEAIVEFVNTGTAPQVTEGLDFYNTGVALVTDNPVEGVESITSAEGLEICWGATS